MLDDVIPPCGGFLPVRIDKYGYIRYNDTYGGVVHRETRQLHELDDHLDSFQEAKATVVRSGRDDAAILELTPEGGGSYVWVPSGRKEELSNRLQRFRVCYGGWPIRVLET